MASLDWAIDVLKRAEAGKLFGSVTISFSEGEVTHAKTEFTEKPPVDSNPKRP